MLPTVTKICTQRIRQAITNSSAQLAAIACTQHPETITSIRYQIAARQIELNIKGIGEKD
jgi:hypothetical protein